MNRRVLALTLFSVTGLACASLFSPPPFLIWNRTASAPEGLWQLSGGPLTRGTRVAVSARSDLARKASALGLTGDTTPLIKTIAGLPGDQICREDAAVLINGQAVAEAREETHSGSVLPAWQGCFWLRDDEVFLLSTEPDSFDGRYTGATKTEELLGPATLIFAAD